MTPRRWNLPVVLCSAATLLLPAVMPAQRSQDRVAVFQLRDSLAALRDTSMLLALESRCMDSARTHRNDAVLHLRLGYLGLRLAELTGGSGHFRDAEGEFQWATELEPKWPLGWYGLGTAELAEADGYPAGLRELFRALGRDIFGPAAHDLARSAEVDSTFVTGVVGLGEESLRRGIGAHLGAALSALREVATVPASHNRSVLLTRGRIERETGDADSAVVAFRSILARNRADGVALLELARTALATGRIGGGEAWFQGLAVADSEALSMYHFDLSLVMSDTALARFDAASGRERVVLARTFWNSRDPESLNGGAERLREHYRRMEYAHREYPLVPPGRRYDSLKAFAASGSLFDDRGRIFVRHGEPDAKASLTMSGLPPNESWVYHREGGDLLFNFAQPDTAQGFRMYESLLDIVGLGTAARSTGQADVKARLDAGNPIATYGAAWVAQAAQELLHSREKLSPVYGQMLSAGINGATALQRNERAMGRTSIDIGLQTDSWKLSYELPLVAAVDVLAVGSDAVGTELQVVFAIPGTSLYAPPSRGRVIYPVRTRIAIRNPAGQVVATVDTLRNFVTDVPIPQDGILLGRLPVHVPPGEYQVRVAVETPSRGIVEKPVDVRVAALSTPAIELSDLALGARSVPLPWATGSADTAWINPLGRFKSGEAMQLFFEVGGLAPGAPYRVQLAVTRAGRKDVQLELGFNSVATGTPDRVHRQVDIGHLGPGGYVMQVTVSTPSGGKVMRQREFSVVR